MFLILCILFALSNAQGEQVALDDVAFLNELNRQRQLYKIPILDWDPTLSRTAANVCRKCVFATSDAKQRQRDLVGFKGFAFEPNAKWQSVGETRAAAVGAGAKPSSNGWSVQQSVYNCLADTCSKPTGCNEFRQLVWKDTTYVGCAQCLCKTGSPLPQEGKEWAYLVCHWNTAAYENEKPFGSDQAAVCGGTYVIKPPPQPLPCGATCANKTRCGPPTAAATCGTDGAWRVNGPLNINQITNVINCSVVVTGGLVGKEGDVIKFNRCGSIKADSVSLTGSVRASIDFDGVTGIAPRQYYRFITYGSISGAFAPPILKEVFTPTVDLCGRTVMGSTGAYNYIYDCGIANPDTSQLPDPGNAFVGVSDPAETTNPPNPSAGGDINSPDNVQVVGPDGSPVPAPSAGGGGGGGLPGWAIFIIVLCVILVIVAIVICIIFLRKKKRGEHV